MAATKKQAAAKAVKKAAEIKDPLLETEEEASTESEVAKVEVKKVIEPEQEEETFNPVKKVAPKAAAEKKVLSEAEQHEADLERFKKEIEKAPKTMFIIPLDPGEKPGSVQVVSLNGVAFTIKKGALVEIPVPIMEILAEKYEVEVSAGKHMLLDRSDEVSDALS